MSGPYNTTDTLKERYFPDVPLESRKLAWLKSPGATFSADTSDTSVRFELSGTALSVNAQTDLPTDLGLHHHGNSPDLAGYTLQDVLYLCRSTVPSQRITMLGVLGKIISKYGFGGHGDDEATRACKEEQVQDKGVKFGVDVILSYSGSLGVMRAGIDLLYEALSISSSAWLDDADPSSHFRSDDDASDKGVFQNLPFEDLVPRLMDLLTPSSGLPPRSIQQLILILRWAVHQTQQVAETVCPVVPLVIRQHVLQKPWPLEITSQPSVEALRLFRDSITSSRTCAMYLSREDVLQPMLKFVIPSTWTSANECHDLTLEVLHSFLALGRYGLCASIVTSGRDVWHVLYRELCLQIAPSTKMSDLISAYFDCLATWTTCAIDPHQTTPEHDLTWAQVSTMGWEDEAIAIISTVDTKSGTHKELASALWLLVAWVEGAGINGVRGGEAEKLAILDKLRRAGLEVVVRRAIDKMAEDTIEVDTIHVLAAFIRLHFQVSFSVGSEKPLLEADVTRYLISRFLFSRQHTNSSTARSMIVLRYDLSRLARRIVSGDDLQCSKTAFGLMMDFRPGEEGLALDLVDDLLLTDYAVLFPSLAEQLSSLTHRNGLQVLRPILHYAIRPDVTAVVGPPRPSYLYLKATSTLRPPAAKRSTSGLPLPLDWLFSPLSELLSSATSLPFAQSPPDWDPSELDIVRASLLLAQLNPNPIGRSSILLNLMKVFMLEHGILSSSTAEVEIFRDPTVSTALSALIVPLTRPTADLVSPSDDLEEVAKPFLGEDVPFFRFYTDFLTLFDSISFSHSLFAQLLLPPLAMTYSVDYRKLLWAEQPTALRSIRTKMRDVPLECGSTRAFFEPREGDADVLAGYTRALIQGWVTEENTEFLFKVAVHHLAGLFWEGEDEERDSPRVGLVVGMLSSAGDGVLRRILLYDLSQPGELMVVGEDEKKRRINIVEELAGSKGSRRITSV